MAAGKCNRWVYPKARRDESVVEELTEEKIKIADPYRYLEDPDSEETSAFVDSQNKISRPYLDSIPEREQFHSRYVPHTPQITSMNHAYGVRYAIKARPVSLWFRSHAGQRCTRDMASVTCGTRACFDCAVRPCRLSALPPL